MALSDEVKEQAGLTGLLEVEWNPAEKRYVAENRTLPELTPVGEPAWLDQNFKAYRHRNQIRSQEDDDKPAGGLDLATELVSTRIQGEIPNKATHYLLGPSRTLYVHEEESAAYSSETRAVMFFEGKVVAIDDYFGAY